MIEQSLRNFAIKNGYNPDWLVSVAKFESGLKLNALNKTSGAFGLIQFMPSLLKSWGYTQNDLKDNLELQLKLIEKYLSPYKSKIKTKYDMYLAVFFPLAIGKENDFVFQTKSLSALKIAQQNGVFDVNKDGKITLAELKQVMSQKLSDTLPKKKV
jgi:hypothetical protein